MQMFFVAGIGIAVFIEILLISKKNKSGSDKILTFWMFLILVHLFVFYMFFTREVHNFPFLLGIEHPLPLLHGVFLYFYVASLTKQLPEKKSLLVLHFLPAALMYAYLATFFVLPSEQKIEVYKNRGAGYEMFNMLKSYAYSLSGIVYVIWSAILLKRHQRNIRDQFSALEKINLQWLQLLTFGLGGIWFLVIFFGTDVLIFSGVVVFIFLIGFFGIRQADIFARTAAPIEEKEPKEKYQKSGLTEDVSEELHKELKRLMADGALYKNSELSISDLASTLGVHPNYLSQVINQKEKKNFYDFVNTYRIEEFKRLIGLQKNRQFTLLSLAHECGFSSKTAFNRSFKKATGLTPSQHVSAQNQPET
ncbi:MAG: helix-turn-helix transcriptional regulator [Bacteroidetes bacterium]|nr:helix-turn-helix transcriptional regulator [Bacteroidota bacterium]MCW5895832.1 helix-turn-helix transcriptional regulator [Bacteroidota bacterium]